MPGVVLMAPVIGREIHSPPPNQKSGALTLFLRDAIRKKRTFMCTVGHVRIHPDAFTSETPKTFQENPPNPPQCGAFLWASPALFLPRPPPAASPESACSRPPRARPRTLARSALPDESVGEGGGRRRAPSVSAILRLQARQVERSGQRLCRNSRGVARFGHRLLRWAMKMGATFMRPLKTRCRT